MSDNQEPWARENERQYRVLDQILTAHSIRAERFKRRALLLDVAVIAASVVLNGFVFAGDDVLTPLGVKPPFLKLAVALSSIAVLALSIVQLRVDWAGLAKLHADAAQQLGDLKLRFRNSWVKGLDAETAAGLASAYEQVMGGIAKIPPPEFPRLVAEHRFRVMCNKVAEGHPACPLALIRLIVRANAVRGFLRTLSPAKAKIGPHDE